MRHQIDKITFSFQRRRTQCFDSRQGKEICVKYNRLKAAAAYVNFFRATLRYTNAVYTMALCPYVRPSQYSIERANYIITQTRVF